MLPNMTWPIVIPPAVSEPKREPPGWQPEDPKDPSKKDPNESTDTPDERPPEPPERSDRARPFADTLPDLE